MDSAKPPADRLRIWIFCSGGFVACALVVQMFILDDLTVAIHLRESFGPFDFSGIEGTPKRSIRTEQRWQSWKLAGWIFNLMLSWGVLTAALRPELTLERLLAYSSRRSVPGIFMGLMLAAFGFAEFTLENATGATWIGCALVGLCLAGISTGWVRKPNDLGRLCGAAARSA